MAEPVKMPPRMPGGWTDSDEFTEILTKTQARELTKSSTMELDMSQPPTPDGTGLPANFAQIAPLLYRSSYPQHAHFSTLASLKLRTIITFVAEPLSFDYANFISANKIVHHQIHIKANKDPSVYTNDATVHSVLELMLNPTNYPMLIHCNKGKHRTGTMTACFRKAMGWSLDACIKEYEKYSAPKDRSLDKAFITRFDETPVKGLALENNVIGGFYAQNMANSARSEYTIASAPSFISEQLIYSVERDLERKLAALADEESVDSGGEAAKT